MKARRRDEVSALRTLLAAIDNAESVDVAPDSSAVPTSAHVAGAREGVGAAEATPRPLSPGELLDIIDREVLERQEEAARYEQLGRDDDAMRLRSEAHVIARYRVADG
jgi:uncharacterized protein YqeY